MFSYARTAKIASDPTFATASALSQPGKWYFRAAPFELARPSDPANNRVHGRFRNQDVRASRRS